MTINEILEKAGGAARISQASKKSGKVIGVRGVYQWQARGIPESHWPLLMSLVHGLTADELFRANSVLRGPRRRPLAPESHVA